jgi:Pectin methylesterase
MKIRLLLLLTLFVAVANATKITVDNTSITTALSTASDGDTLLMAGGIYSTAINFQNGKTLTLKSAGTGSVIFNGTIGGNASTDTNCGLIFEGITINRGNSYVMDGSTFGNIKIVAFRNDTILNVNRCLIRGGNTTATTLGTIEVINCIVKNCGSAGYALLYPKFNVSNVNIRNSTFIRYYGGENLFRPQVNNTANVLNFTFENNTVFKWSKGSGYALCYASNLQSTASNFIFRNNIIAEPGVAGQSPKVLNVTGGNLIAQKNLIVNYGRFSLSAPTTVDTTTNNISANLYDRAIGFQDTSSVSNDFRILSTSPLAIAGTTGGPVGDPRWITTVAAPAVLSTVVSPADAGTVAPGGGTFNKGQSVTLTATRSFGYTFKEWQDASGNTLSTSNPYTVVMDKDKTIKAVFSTVTTYDLTLNKQGDGAQWGNVSLNPAPTNGKYEAGTIVDVVVVPNGVSSFLYWDDATSQTSRQIVMDAPKTISATFDVVPFIVGWDFAASTPVSNRVGDYFYQTDNTGLLNNYTYTGTTTTWGASTKTFGGITYNSARRYSDAALLIANTPRYLQARFSGVGYKNITIKSKIGADNTCVNKVQKMQYSLDGVKYITLDSIDISGAYNAAWVDCNTVLPEMADSLKKTIYIRWIPESTSGYIQDATPATGATEGFYLANVFVYAETAQIDDVLAPQLVSSLPAMNSTTASANGSITLTFSERVKAGTGDFTFNGKTISPVFGNKTVSFAYTNLEYGKSYSFTVPAGAITDLSGNKFSGVTILFSTMIRPQPIAKLYDAVVAKDGSGDYTTVQAAINAVPDNRTSPWLIFVKNGTYEELIRIPESKPFINLIGQDKEKTIITFAINCSSGPTDTGWDYNKGQYGMSDCATVVAAAHDFYAENISFENRYGIQFQNGPMALAMRSNNDRFAFNNCKFRSFQDTWYTTSRNASDRHFANNCYIEGAVDYVYGGGDAFFDKCTLYNVRSGSVIVAPSHATATKYGYAFNSCTIDGNTAAADGNLKLGRPWQNSPRAVYLNSNMKILPHPEGWTDMGVIPGIFAEYNSMDSKGNPIDLSSRRTWFKTSAGVVTTGLKPVLTQSEAAQYTYENMMTGTDNWNPRAYFEPVVKPANVTLSNGSQLAWTKSNYAICYVILRDSAVISFTKDPSFTDNTALSGSTYKYQVRAVNEYGSLSPVSDIAIKVSTGVDILDLQKPVISVSDSWLVVSNLPEGSVLTLISVDGKVLASEKVSGDSCSKFLPSLKGVYILKVNKKSYKVIF